MLRGAVRAHAHRAPRLYNLRNDLLAYPQHLRRRVHDPDFLTLASLGCEQPLVFDVGANVGQSIVSIKAVLPQAQVIAFEPIERAARRCTTIARRYEDVEVRAVACGRLPDQQLTLYVPEARGVRFEQLAGVHPPDVDEVLLHLQHGGFTWASRADVELREVSVPSIALGGLGLRPHAIKIDVEGEELAVLQGAESLLEGSDAVRLLIVERGDADEIRSYLEARSYVMESSNVVNAVYRRVDGRQLG